MQHRYSSAAQSSHWTATSLGPWYEPPLCSSRLSSFPFPWRRDCHLIWPKNHCSTSATEDETVTAHIGGRHPGLAMAACGSPTPLPAQRSELSARRRCRIACGENWECCINTHLPFKERLSNVDLFKKLGSFVACLCLCLGALPSTFVHLGASSLYRHPSLGYRDRLGGILSIS